MHICSNYILHQEAWGLKKNLDIKPQTHYSFLKIYFKFEFTNLLSEDIL